MTTRPSHGLRVYVSPRSHAFYPSAGRWIRVLGMVNDLAAADNVWQPSPADFQAAHSQSWSTSHFQVRRGINGPQNCVDPTVSSMTFMERAVGIIFPCVRTRLAAQPRIRIIAGPLND